MENDEYRSKSSHEIPKTVIMTTDASLLTTTTSSSLFSEYSRELVSSFNYPSTNSIFSSALFQTLHPFTRTQSAHSLQLSSTSEISPVLSTYSLPSSTRNVDSKYIERRNRNNAAVKKCRENKRQQEEETSIAVENEKERYKNLKKQVQLAEIEFKILQELVHHCRKHSK